MKKYFVFFAVLMLGIVSCNRQNFSGTDLVIIDHGEMSFYDVETQKLTPFDKEPDSVLNLLFDESNHLYYTVSNNEKLSLKMIDLNASKPAPKQCIDWNMTLQNSIDEFSGEVSNLFWDKTRENICIHKTDYDDYDFSILLYNVNTGKVTELSGDEAYTAYYIDKNFDASHFFSEARDMYYATPKGKVCLTDKVDFTKAFEDEAELEDLYFDPEAISPDGNRLVYAATIFWGEGWGFYGLANLDGTGQRLMMDTDIWDLIPRWLPDGSLVYVGKAPRPKEDPEYDEEWNNTQPCIMLLDANNNAKQLSLGKTFAVKPCGEKKDFVCQQTNLAGCDVAVLDQGKVTFYNSTTGEFVPFVNEKDSVINAVFVNEDDFYYTVAIGDELYLKEVYLSDYVTQPSMRTSWDLKLDDCVSQTYGKASTLAWIPAFDRVGISYNFSWDYYNFADIKFFAYYDNKKLDGWNEDEDVETDIYDEEFWKYENDLEHFVSDENQYFYVPEEGEEICLTDKINFEEYCSDPEYYEAPEFVFYSINPTRTCVAYGTIIEWGDLGHGPLCMSSLDGKVQVAFKDTDAADLTWGWMPDGSLLYLNGRSIMIVRPNGTEEVFAKASDFVVSTK